MTDNAETLQFIKISFRSVWSLELMLLLKSDPDRGWSNDALVERLRASDSVVQQSIEALVAGGLVLTDDNGVRYAPASPDLRRLADAAVELYARKPDAVRRAIVMAASDPLTAFADAFRLRKD